MKKRLITLLLALCLCFGLTVPGFAASSEENNAAVDVYVTELDAGYYLCAVWRENVMLCLFDYTVGSDGVLKTTVDVGEALPTGTQVQVGISSANAGGKEIAPVVCSTYTPSDEPANPTGPAKPLYSIYIPNVSGGIVTAPAQSSYADTYIPLTVYPSRGYELGNIFVTDGAGNRLPVSYSGGQYWFAMPSSSVTVYATFISTAYTSSVPSVTSTTTSRPEYVAQTPLTLNVYAFKSGSNGRPASGGGRLLYSVDVTLSAAATGGTDYSYQFEIKQNGVLTRSTGWTSNNVYSGQLSGSGTCIAEISVKDTSGRTTTATLDLLGQATSASSIGPGSATVPASSPTGSLSIGISNSAFKSIVGSSYDIRLNLAAHASGGDGNYSYKFIILQNGEVTQSTDWSNYNGISGDLSGNGTCVVEIYVKDSSGRTASTTVNLLEQPQFPGRR